MIIELELTDDDMVKFYANNCLHAVMHIDAFYTPVPSKLYDEIKTGKRVKIRFQLYDSN